MATRIINKIGDIFVTKLNENEVKYFQYKANDLLQLNSSVIRGFRKIYHINDNPSIESIINDDTAFYAHTIISAGIKMGVWKKFGKHPNIGEKKDMIFRSCDDYGIKKGEESVKISHKWYVWKINDTDFTYVGELKGENRNAYIGLVINPLGIIELLKGNKYPPLYPDFE